MSCNLNTTFKRKIINFVSPLFFQGGTEEEGVRRVLHEEKSTDLHFYIIFLSLPGSISPTFYVQLLCMQNRLKDSQVKQLFALLGLARVKAAS